MKVGVGGGVAVAVAVADAGGVSATIGLADAAGVPVTRAEGAGCEVHALKRTRHRVHERMSAFMRAIMAETRPCVNVTQTGARNISRPGGRSATFKINGQRI